MWDDRIGKGTCIIDSNARATYRWWLQWRWRHVAVVVSPPLYANHRVIALSSRRQRRRRRRNVCRSRRTIIRFRRTKGGNSRRRPVTVRAVSDYRESAGGVYFWAEKNKLNKKKTGQEFRTSRLVSIVQYNMYIYV